MVISITMPATKGIRCECDDYVCNRCEGKFRFILEPYYNVPTARKIANQLSDILSTLNDKTSRGQCKKRAKLIRKIRKIRNEIDCWVDYQCEHGGRDPNAGGPDLSEFDY